MAQKNTQNNKKTTPNDKKPTSKDQMLQRFQTIALDRKKAEELTDSAIAAEIVSKGADATDEVDNLPKETPEALEIKEILTPEPKVHENEALPSLPVAQGNELLSQDKKSSKKTGGKKSTDPYSDIILKRPKMVTRSLSLPEALFDKLDDIAELTGTHNRSYVTMILLYKAITELEKN